MKNIENFWNHILKPWPPWDHPAWLTYDPISIISNFEKLALDIGEKAGIVLDLRSPILSAIWRHLEEEFRRRGCNRYFTDRPLFQSQFDLNTFQDEEDDGWQKFLAHPTRADMQATAFRAGFTLVIGHISEAIILSNCAQALDRRCKILVRVRHPDLIADSGPTAVLSILECLPQLPLLQLCGFYFDQPFNTRNECDAFGRAIRRCIGESSGLIALTRFEGPLPSRLRTLRIIGYELLGLASKSQQPLSATLTLEAWGVPLSARESGMTLAVDLGTTNAFPNRMPATLFVEGQPAKVVRLEERRLVLETDSRPSGSSPWRVLLLGSAGEEAINEVCSISPSDWPDGLPIPLLENLIRNWPDCFIPVYK